jgi:hypothetical protein
MYLGMLDMNDTFRVTIICLENGLDETSALDLGTLMKLKNPSTVYETFVGI